MKAFLLGAIVATGLAIGTYYVLNDLQRDADTAYATTGVRLDRVAN